ncbi:MAG: hypothetical protein WC810_25335 [Janthinobacterium sp.]|jgi:hypothetical protein
MIENAKLDIQLKEEDIVKDPFEILRREKERASAKTTETTDKKSLARPSELSVMNYDDFNMLELDAAESESSSSATKHASKRDLGPAPIRLQFGRGGNRLHIRGDLHSHIGNPSLVSVAFGKAGCLIAGKIPNICNEFAISFGGKVKECAIYKKELVAEIIQKLDIPYPVGASSYCYYDVEAIVINNINAILIKPFKFEDDNQNTSTVPTSDEPIMDSYQEEPSELSNKN